MSKFDIKKITSLARLQISSEEQSIMEEKLDKIMEMIIELQKVDTTNVAPMITPLDMQKKLRADDVTASGIENLNESRIVEGLYTVPEVIEDV